MGARLTTFQNKSDVDIELRVFVPPARPDHFQKIIEIKPGRKVKILINKAISKGFTSADRSVMVMLFVDGVYSGLSLLPAYLVGYSEVICDRGQDGYLNVRGIKSTLLASCKSRLLTGMNYFGMVYEEIL